jgi:acyl carrier protein
MQISHEQVWRRVSLEIARARGDAGELVLQPAQTPLAELGLDSLKLVEIIYELETFYQLDVDEERLAELGRVGDLIELFVGTRTGPGEQPTPGGHHDTDL